MCGKAPTPPTPKAPPAPIPQTDSVMESRDTRQRAAAQSSQSGYQSTMLTERNMGDAQTASPVLGG